MRGLAYGPGHLGDELRLLFGRHGVESPDEGGSEHAGERIAQRTRFSPTLRREGEDGSHDREAVRIVLEATLRARMSTFLVSSARFMPSIISPEREYAKKSNNLLLQRAKVVYSVRILIWRTIARSSEHSEASWRGRACQCALVCLHLFLLSIPLAHGGMHVPTPHVYACV